MADADDRRQRFARDGYLIIEPEIPHETLEGVIRDLNDYWGSMKPWNVSFAAANRLQDAWRISRHAYRIAVWPAIMRVLVELYGRRPLPFQTINFPKGSEQRPHSDLIHFHCEPARYMCGVWVALEDIGPDQGPLIYYPGSHRLPYRSYQDFGIEPGYANYPQYEDAIARIVDEEGLVPTIGILRKGQALIWSANLVHGGMPVRDRRRSRHSQVTHCYFEGCRYWRPVHTRDRPRYFIPNWIPYRGSPYRPNRLATFKYLLKQQFLRRLGSG